MSSEKRAVSIIVAAPGTCPLLKAGEGFALRGNDLSNSRGGRLCARGVCSIIPQVEAVLENLNPEDSLPSATMTCGAADCGAQFRLEQPSPKDQSGLFTTPSMRRKADRAFLDVVTPGEKPQSFMRTLTLDLRDELNFIGQSEKYDDGQSILKQGEPVHNFNILLHGMAGVVAFRDEKETLIGSVGEGEFFGEFALLSGLPGDYEVRAVGLCSVLKIARKEFLNLVLKRSALMRVMTRIVAEKVKAASASVENELSRGILGKLSMIPLIDLVQTFSQSRRTGTLVIHQSTTQAFIVFLNGAVISAVAGALKGETAFFSVLGWQDGEFCFEPSELFEPAPKREGAISAETIALLMEGMRRIDEARMDDEVLVDDEAPMDDEPKSDAANVTV